MTGYVADTKVMLYAVINAHNLIAGTTSSKLVQLNDDGLAAPVVRVVKTAPSNVVYRGVSMAPE